MRAEVDILISLCYFYSGREVKAMKNGNKIKNITMTALGTVFLAVCSWISVGGITLQTLAIFFLIYYFGGKRATAIISVYLLMGALGLPVFSGFGGGIGWFFGPTGGFLLCFLLVGGLHILAEHIFKSNFMRWYLKIPLAVISVLICYFCGAISMYFYYLQNGSSLSFSGVFLSNLLFFGLFDAAKIVFAHFMAKYMKRIKTA